MSYNFCDTVLFYSHCPPPPPTPLLLPHSLNSISLHFRCATTCLIMVLCVLYPQYMFWFQLLVILDICSHWIQMYSSLIHGEASHKVTDLSANPIMRLYYMRVSINVVPLPISRYIFI